MVWFIKKPQLFSRGSQNHLFIDYINIPPHTCNVCPVTYADISEAKNTVAFATSNGDPPLFKGIEFLHS